MSFLADEGRGDRDPREIVLRTLRDINRYVKDMLRDILREGKRFFPSMDIYDRGEDYLLILSLPGVEPSTLKLEASEEELNLSGERILTLPEGYGELPPLEKALLRTNLWGPFSFTIPLPSKVDPKGVKATLYRGMMIITAPKKEKPRRVDIG